MENSQRRNFERYPCSGAAELFRDAQLCAWGSVSEIGQGGCYVETGNPLSPNDQVHLRLTIAGLVLETPAAIAWVTPQVGMGLRFEPVSAEAKAKIAQFLHKVTGDAKSAVASAFAPVPAMELETERAPRTSRSAGAITPEAALRILSRIVQRVRQTGILTEQELLEIVNGNR